MKKLGKNDLARIVGNKLGATHKDAKRILGTVLETVTECLGEGYEVKIRDFGRFEVRSYGEVKKRNPKTGETFIVPPKSKVLFRAGEGLRSEVQS
ncbi:MAG: HU family DNA-binding protein [bacterium]|nr:HU family DNA-binding protein [bacterium]